ncbi:hypothetical protein LCGC14_3116000 [marine sediment metagenome]|uniref:Uncharacterized protein n=1 Tax=marine sediment metagenome TaxID=412755 RepID=A0A0F8YTK6_9ZZZZ
MNRKTLARNIRHRLADMLGSRWSGALDVAMDEMLLEEIDKFDIVGIQPAAKKPEVKEAAVHQNENDGSTAWPLRERPEGDNPYRKRDEDGDPYLKGIMEKD